MDIVFASNTNYVEHLAVAIRSLLNSNSEEKFTIHIINGDINEVTWNQLETIVANTGSRLVDVKISNEGLRGLVTPHHLTKETYYRLFIPETLQTSKALYLDADIVVNGPLRELYETNVDDFFLAAVETPGFIPHHDLRMSRQSKYFNAGVVLINIAMWRRERVKERVIDVIRERPWAIQFADQCGLNAVIDGRWKELHPKFNVQSYLYKENIDDHSPFFPEGVLISALENPVILHFSGSSKPWHFGYKHPYRSLYWGHLRKTPFRRWLSNDISFLKVMKWCVPGVIKNAIRKGGHRD